MSKVFTIKGLVDREALEVLDIITETSNSRDIATEWYLDGELVRRDVAVSILAPVATTIEAKQGALGG